MALALDPQLVTWLDGAPSEALGHLCCTCQGVRDVLLDSERIWLQCLINDFGADIAKATEMSSTRGGGRLAVKEMARERRRFVEDIIFVKGDLHEVLAANPVDSFICPTVGTCAPYGPCAAVVHGVAGPELMAHIENHVLPRLPNEELGFGEAVGTPAFRWQGAKAIIHVNGPSLFLAPEAQEYFLQEAYKKALDEAVNFHRVDFVEKVATASISTGGNGLPLMTASPIALMACRDALRTGRIGKIYVILYDAATLAGFNKAKAHILEHFTDDVAAAVAALETPYEEHLAGLIA
mmetsp:Transcript_22580/g.41583  ORF Transcript_22580/g.41583 Transcript_22580/m.41583 type:complete len:294 (-) Transcript_22580:140-1021(-)